MKKTLLIILLATLGHSAYAAKNDDTTWAVFERASGFTLVNTDNQAAVTNDNTQCEQQLKDADCGKIEISYQAGKYSDPVMTKLMAQH
jgi:hypothetical protein